MEDYKQYKQVFSLRMAGYLMMNGCRLMRVHHDLKGTSRDVYLFKDTEKLNEKILEYLQIKRTKENENVIDQRSRSSNSNKKYKILS